MRISRTSQVIMGGLIAVTFIAVQTTVAQTAAPSIASINPSSAFAGDPGFNLTVFGANFVPGSTVLWSGVSLQATTVSSAVLSVAVPANLITLPGLFTVSVVGPYGNKSNDVIFNILQRTLSITVSTLPAASFGKPYSFVLTASGGNPDYTWSVFDQLPAGLQLTPNGLLAGTPTVSGTFTFTVRVADRMQTSAIKSLSLTVGPPPLSIATASPLPPARVGVPYALPFSANSGLEPFRWAMGSGAPSGLTLNPTTGILSGTPDIKGTFTFTVQVADRTGFSVTKDFTVTVKPPPLVITTEPPLFAGTVGNAYSQPFTASGGTLPYRWSITSGQIGGLVLDSNTGSLAGVPSAKGSFSFALEVTDSAGESARRDYILVVNARTIAIINGPTLPKGTVGMPYSQTLVATGSVPPFAWSIAGGWIPGLKLDPAIGVVGGTPTEAGTFTFVVELRDGAGAMATKTFVLTVDPAALVITTDLQLPAGRIGDEYFHTLGASGGLRPYVWSVNGLPDGLVLDAATGSISGIPTAPGSFSFAVRVTDTARVTAVALFRITLDLPPLPSVLIGGPPAESLPAQQHFIQVELDEPFPVTLTGQLLLSFAPDIGGGDGTIQFSTGGRSAPFRIPAGTFAALFDIGDLAFQTGTVAGNILFTVQLQSSGVDVTPQPAPTASIRINRSAPVITAAKVLRKDNGFDIQVAGFCTSREITEAVFRFSTPAGNSLQQAEFKIPLDGTANTWFQDPGSSRFGSQFTFTQPFTVQGDARAVNPVSITLTNRLGTTTATLTP